LAKEQFVDPPVDPVRRRIMQAVRGASTTPERAVRSALFARGYRFRRNVRTLPGTPDLVLGARKIAIFVHGCFWHRHPGCCYATTPKTRCDFWQTKFDRNVKRDAEKRRELEEAGWTVLEIWGCEVKSGGYLEPLLARLGPPRATACPSTTPA
jgi:DNA mismatch endonuclease, patch repair protein